jgi:hypothetical protein
MKQLFRMVPVSVGIAIIATILAPGASAGCAGVPARPAAALGPDQHSYLVQAAYRPAEFVLVDGTPGPDVVGLWHVVFTQNKSFGGGLFDDSYAAWHSDGTEIMNSGAHSPAYGNFCMGVWTKTGHSTFTLKHIALDYSMQPVGSTTPSVIVIIREEVTVDRTGNHFTGSFTADIYAPYSSSLPATPGAHIAQVGAGPISGDRITAD